MISIAHTISELISIHDCVIVPGLGGFVANYQSAEIDTDKGLFTPPNKEIGFNKILVHNDGLLYHSVSTKTKCNYDDAKQLVDDFVIDVNFQINTSGFCHIGDIGELSKDNLDNYKFTPNSSGSFLADAFGLAPFHVALPNHIKSIKNTETPILKMVSRVLINRGVAASIILFAGLFLLTTEIKNPRNVSLGSMSGILESTQTVDMAANMIETKSTDYILTAVTANNNIKAVDKAESINYHLVIASFPSAANAEAFKQKMVNKGFANCAVISSPGKNRVAIEHFTNREEAFASLDQCRQTTKFKTAWLLKEKQ